MTFTREWAMPSPDTFSIPPIGLFVRKHLAGVSVDPFARNGKLATVTNDLNPNTTAEFHMDAVAFLDMLREKGTKADVVLIDPPYSPRQISECYAEAGLKCGMKDTQNAALYKRVKDAANGIVAEGGVVLSFGWNSSGMGKGRGYAIEEILIVCHGGAHNDTICVAERKLPRATTLFDG